MEPKTFQSHHFKNKHHLEPTVIQFYLFHFELQQSSRNFQLKHRESGGDLLKHIGIWEQTPHLPYKVFLYFNEKWILKLWVCGLDLDCWILSTYYFKYQPPWRTYSYPYKT